MRRHFNCSCLLRGRTRSYFDSVLGTSTISGKMLADMKADMTDMNISRVESIRDCVIKKGELDHMDNPDDDVVQLKKIERLADDFFSKIPMPSDPMAAALAPTKDEVVDNERFEILRELVRERYLASCSARRREASRIDAAMQRVSDGSWKPAAATSSVSVPRVEAPVVDAEKENLRREVEDLKRRLAEFEKAQKGGQ